jgi:DGQHR domain-containing protein
MFALTGEEILQLADISRLSRSRNGRLLGYQRPEVRRHIQNIVDYLDSDSVLFPNSIILALSSKATFQKSRGPKAGDSLAEAGVLTIPIPKNGELKPAWIVDGQQRVIALSKSSRIDLAVPVTVFIADDVATQRDQFLRINSAKPLPRGLITELLPEISTVLPANLAVRRIPSAVCDFINSDPESPFYAMIRRPSLTREQRRRTVITDTSIIKMLQDSLENPSGCLFAYRQIGTGSTDFEGIVKVLYTFWGGVKATFPEAWGKPPSHSRLMHGAGIRSMGKLMDRIMSTLDPSRPDAISSVIRQLEAVRPVCRWTRGSWEELSGLPWNSVQNISTHIRALASVIIRAHVATRESRK